MCAQAYSGHLFIGCQDVSYFRQIFQRNALSRGVMDGDIIGFAGDAVVAEVMVYPYRFGNLATVHS